MGGPTDGKYYILPANGPDLLAGVDGHGGPEVPVVLGGKNNVFTIRKSENGNYTLVLEDYGPFVFIQDSGPSLVANHSSPASDWAIEEQASGSYTIKVPPPKWFHWKWFVVGREPGSPISMSNSDNVEPTQLWKFIHAPEGSVAGSQETNPL